MDETELLITSEDDEMNRLVRAVENSSISSSRQERRGSAPNMLTAFPDSKPSRLPPGGEPRNQQGWLHKLGFGSLCRTSVQVVVNPGHPGHPHPLLGLLGFKRKRGSDAGLSRVAALKAQSTTGGSRPRSSSVDFGLSQLPLSSPGHGTYAVITSSIRTPPSSLENLADVKNGAKDASDVTGRKWTKVQPPGTIEYTATVNDSLSSIAAKHQTTTSQLMKINRLMSSMIFPGQTLFVPGENYTSSEYEMSARTAGVNNKDDRRQVVVRPGEGRRRSSLTDIDQDNANKKGGGKKKSKSKSPPGKNKTPKRRLSDTDCTQSSEILAIFKSDVRYITNTCDSPHSSSSIQVCMLDTQLCLISYINSKHLQFSSSPPISLTRMPFDTRIISWKLVGGTLTLGTRELLFEPEIDGADDLSRYRLLLSKNLITASIHNSITNGANQPDIYQRSTGSVDNTDQKRAADKTKNAKKTEKSTFSPLLFPLAIAIPDSIVAGVDSRSVNTASSMNSQINVASDSKYLCVKLGISTDEVEDRPAIGSLIKSVLPTTNWIEYWMEHFFVIPTNRVDELDRVLSSWLCPDNSIEQNEKRDVVSPDVQMRRKPDNKANRRQFRRTLSAAELHNLPLPELSHPSHFIAETHIRTLREHLPPRVDGRPWLLVFSSERDGFSLGTLYRRMNGFNCPTLFACQDTSNNIFGAMSLCPLKIDEGFYGSGEMFLFTFQPFFKKFAWSGKNSFNIRGNNNSLSFGASDGCFGLWLDDDLNRGRTQRCETFDNDPLTDGTVQDFTVRWVEVWAFP